MAFERNCAEPITMLLCRPSELPKLYTLRVLNAWARTRTFQSSQGLGRGKGLISCSAVYVCVAFGAKVFLDLGAVETALGILASAAATSNPALSESLLLYLCNSVICLGDTCRVYLSLSCALSLVARRTDSSRAVYV